MVLIPNLYYVEAQVTAVTELRYKKVDFDKRLVSKIPCLIWRISLSSITNSYLNTSHAEIRMKQFVIHFYKIFPIDNSLFDRFLKLCGLKNIIIALTTRLTLTIL